MLNWRKGDLIHGVSNIFHRDRNYNFIKADLLFLLQNLCSLVYNNSVLLNRSDFPQTTSNTFRFFGLLFSCQDTLLYLFHVVLSPQLDVTKSGCLNTVMCNYLDMGCLSFPTSGVAKDVF
jgi:hypothetical protein